MVYNVGINNNRKDNKMRTAKFGDKPYRYEIMVNPIFPDDNIVRWGDWLFGTQEYTPTQIVYILRYIGYYGKLPKRAYELEEDEIR